MEIVESKQLFSRLLPHLPGGVSDAVVLSAINYTAREFYRKTRAWRTTIKLTPDMTGTVPLHPLLGSIDACWLEVLYSNDDDYDLARAAASPGHFLMWAKRNDGTKAARAAMLDEHTLQLDGEEFPELFLELSVQPGYDVDVLPASALTHHEPAIVSGVLGELMQQSAKPWTNIEMADRHRARFLAGQADLIHAQKTGYGAGIQPWRFPVTRAR